MTELERDGHLRRAVGARDVAGAWILLSILCLSIFSGALIRAMTTEPPRPPATQEAPIAGQGALPPDAEQA